jgi:hypothetical protein
MGLKIGGEPVEILYFTAESVQEKSEDHESRTCEENSSRPVSEPSRGSSEGSPYSMSSISTRSKNETCNSPSGQESVKPSSDTEVSRQSAVNESEPGMLPVSFRDARCPRHPDKRVWNSEELMRMIRTYQGILCPGCIHAAGTASLARPANSEA